MEGSSPAFVILTVLSLIPIGIIFVNFIISYRRRKRNKKAEERRRNFKVIRGTKAI